MISAKPVNTFNLNIDPHFGTIRVGYDIIAQTQEGLTKDSMEDVAIAMSPMLFKNMAMKMTKVVEQYETRFGEIPELDNNGIPQSGSKIITLNLNKAN